MDDMTLTDTLTLNSDYSSTMYTLTTCGGGGSGTITANVPSNVSITSSIWAVNGVNSWANDGNVTTSLEVKGNIVSGGDITIKGRALSERLDKIEERLAILHHNDKLEEKWSKLRELGQQYREMEAQIIEMELGWSKIRGDA